MRLRSGPCVLLCLFLAPAQGQIATFTPASPRVGDIISVTYFPASSRAAIRNVNEITLQTLVAGEVGKSATLIETPLQKRDSVWKGSFRLQSKTARLVLYQFVSGRLKDDNEERGWDAMVVSGDGMPLEYAHYWRAAVIAFGGYGGFKHLKDVEGARNELAQEEKAYPNDYFAFNLAWYLEVNPVPSDAAIARVRKDLEGVLARFQKNDEALPMLLVWLEQTGQNARADSIRRMAIAANPKGKVASASLSREISNEQDPAKKSAALEKYLASFSMTEEERLANQRQLVMSYVMSERYDKAHLLLKSASKLEPGLYKTLASPLIEKGVSLEKAVGWLAEGIGRARKEGLSAKPPLSPRSDWLKARSSTLASLLNLYGRGLTRLQKTGEAESAFAEAFKLTNGADLSVNTNLIDAEVQNGKYAAAEALGLECIGKGKSSLSFVEKFKAAFTKNHASLAGYDKAVQNAKSRQEAMILKAGTNKPAPDFTLRDMSGADIRLSGFRGKVVVVSFWGTWCGESRMLFPQLQKVVERYEGYRNVAFLAVNSGEESSGAAREALVKKFMTDTKLSFPVLYDEGSSCARNFGLEGIPTTLIIDQNGSIRFRYIGFSDRDEFVDELTTGIDLLLKH